MIEKEWWLGFMIYTTIWEYFTVINDTKWADDTLNLSLSLTGLAEIFIVYSILDKPPPYKKRLMMRKQTTTFDYGVIILPN